LYASADIRVMESRRMILVGHIARMGEIKNAYEVLTGKHGVKRLLKNLGVDR
jgi:hypothetical protein